MSSSVSCEVIQPASESRAANVRIGSALLVLGSLGVLLLLLAGLDCLPARWQLQIQGNAPAWCLGAGILLVAGISQLWKIGHSPEGWAPALDGQRFATVVVYRREDCPLCEEAVDKLGLYSRWLAPMVEVNVDEDPELLQLYGETVPVVAFDGRLRFRGCVNERLLRRLIEGTAPRPLLRRR